MSITLRSFSKHNGSAELCWSQMLWVGKEMCTFSSYQVVLPGWMRGLCPQVLTYEEWPMWFSGYHVDEPPTVVPVLAATAKLALWSLEWLPQSCHSDCLSLFCPSLFSLLPPGTIGQKNERWEEVGRGHFRNTALPNMKSYLSSSGSKSSCITFLPTH